MIDMRAVTPAKESRFSARALQAFAAAGLPAGLQLRAATADAPAEIMLYDEIGPWGVTAEAFMAALADAGAGRVKVRINSPGGHAFQGMAIYNALRAHRGGVDIQVDGIAASAAAYVAMAGTNVVMGEQSMLMIHNCWTVAAGNRHEMAKSVDLMAKIDGQQVAMFAERTGKAPEEIAAMMDAETYFTAQEAVDGGFADSVMPAPPKREKRAEAPPAPSANADPQPEPEPAPTPVADAREKLRLRARLALAHGEID